VAVLSTPASTKVAAIAGVGKLLAILALAAVGLVLVNSQPATTLMNQTPFSAGHLGPAFVAIIFAYDGFQSATLLAGEVRDPKRTLPLGLLLGLGLIVLAYVGINSVYFRVLGFAGVASSDAVAAQTLAVTVGPRGSQMIAAMVMASTLGTLAAQTVGLPRYFIAPAEDGLFPSWLARLTTRASTPANAVITLAGAAMLLLIAGDYGALISVCVLVGYPLNAISLLGAVRLRLKEGPPGGFSMPLYPLPLLIFVGGIAATLAASLVGNSQTLFYALGVPASGTAVYAFQRRCKARAGHGASGA
jgi:APA family basic amino acid/polyamine antiporter